MFPEKKKKMEDSLLSLLGLDKTLHFKSSLYTWFTLWFGQYPHTSRIHCLKDLTHPAKNTHMHTP